MEHPWCVTQAKINEAIDRIVHVSAPRKIILFGSVARGEAGPDSDVDMLVVQAHVPNRYAEIVRLTRCLRGLLLSVDLLVVGESELDELKDVPGSVYRTALREGHVVYEAA